MANHGSRLHPESRALFQGGWQMPRPAATYGFQRLRDSKRLLGRVLLNHGKSVEAIDSFGTGFKDLEQAVDPSQFKNYR